MKTTQEKIAIMQAYVDGKTLQIKTITGEWEDWRGTRLFPDPGFDWGRCDYRIKEDMEQKALDVYSKAVGVPSYNMGDFEKPGWRAVIDAVKRGEIT